MNIESFRDHCIGIKGATESFPFIDPNVLVFKVMGKMFAYIDIAPKDGVFRACMKCDPERSVALRAEYAGVTSGIHTPHAAWNAVYLESDVPDTLIAELIKHSADEVISHLPKKRQQAYHNSIATAP
ncbi:MAG: MmcQ/YjbR family DNA-binding protein [Prevotellaceae bacterium]|jgi:predicted DNA-binding protein (MmcQ/YjbR family)|nr:MmcQ/YjbR family DNA-binding protein [Prevotellaceae bacterium]